MFKNLDRFQVDASSTTELEMRELGRKAVLVLAPATEANPNYHNGFLKLTAKIRKEMTGGDVDGEVLAQLRDVQRELFWRFVIKGWSGVEGEPGGDGVDADGMVPFSRENAKALCRALPNHLFDKLSLGAGAPEAFYAEDEISGPDPDELDGLAGN